MSPLVDIQIKAFEGPQHEESLLKYGTTIFVQRREEAKFQTKAHRQYIL